MFGQRQNYLLFGVSLALDTKVLLLFFSSIGFVLKSSSNPVVSSSRNTTKNLEEKDGQTRVRRSVSA